MLDGEVAEVDYQAGRIGPPPSWLRVMYAAKWMGVSPWELISQPDEWTEWAQMLMAVETKAQERQSKKGGKR